MANLYLLFSKALQNYVITMKSGEETTFVTTLLMSLLNCYGLLRGGNLLEIVVVMGGMVARWASLLATRDDLPSLGEAVASAWTGAGGSAKESEREL